MGDAQYCVWRYYESVLTSISASFIGASVAFTIMTAIQQIIGLFARTQRRGETVAESQQQSRSDNVGR